MRSNASTANQYIEELSDERKPIIKKIRSIFKKQLPKGFKEVMSYGMLGYVVPHSLYPKGYHCDTKLPLPFINVASQKNHVAIYHMGLYANSPVLDWFVDEFPKHSSRKLDMGKCCIRFKNMNDIPYELISELATKITPEEWIETYEKNLERK